MASVRAEVLAASKCRAGARSEHDLNHNQTTQLSPKKSPEAASALQHHSSFTAPSSSVTPSSGSSQRSGTSLSRSASAMTVDSYRQNLSPERFDSNLARPGKTKVSEIAHLFQSEIRRKSDVSSDEDTLHHRISPHRLNMNGSNGGPAMLKSSSLSTSALPTSSSSAGGVANQAVNVRRTESQAARFNNARALFEKLGTGQAGSSVKPVAPLVPTTAGSPTRSISSRPARNAYYSLAGSQSSLKPGEVRPTSSDGRMSTSPLSSTPSPPRHTTSPSIIPKAPPPPVPTKPEVKPKKPELFKKPDNLVLPSPSTAPASVSSSAASSPSRPVINKREVIEKHKNWTCHFTAQRKAPASPEKKVPPTSVVTSSPSSGVVHTSAAPLVTDPAPVKRVVSTLHYPVPSFPVKTSVKADLEEEPKENSEAEPLRPASPLLLKSPVPAARTTVEVELSKSRSAGSIFPRPPSSSSSVQSVSPTATPEAPFEAIDVGLKLEKSASDSQVLEAINLAAVERFESSRPSTASSLDEAVTDLSLPTVDMTPIEEKKVEEVTDGGIYSSESIPSPSPVGASRSSPVEGDGSVHEEYDATVTSAMEFGNEPTVIELSSLEAEASEGTGSKKEAPKQEEEVVEKPADGHLSTNSTLAPPRRHKVSIVSDDGAESVDLSGATDVVESVFDEPPSPVATKPSASVGDSNQAKEEERQQQEEMAEMKREEVEELKPPMAEFEELEVGFDGTPEPLLKDLPPIPQDDDIGVEAMTEEEQERFLSQQFDSFSSDNEESWPPEGAEIHWCENGGFYVEIEGLPPIQEYEEYEEAIRVKTPTKLRFSNEPIKVYCAHAVHEYDRKNDSLDPLGAQAEYELEKRIEKMEVFPVEFYKGPEGLGISIIGMGVGADGGVEKLGIFVKSITKGGAADKDGKIQVNDQIIEVDGKSLVGVTQAYAASVLRNTKGLVKFLIGRDRDGDNGEVATLIRQSVEADRMARDRELAEMGDDFRFHEQRLAAEDHSVTSDEYASNSRVETPQLLGDELAKEGEAGSATPSPRPDVETNHAEVKEQEQPKEQQKQPQQQQQLQQQQQQQQQLQQLQQQIQQNVQQQQQKIQQTLQQQQHSPSPSPLQQRKAPPIPPPTGSDDYNALTAHNPRASNGGLEPEDQLKALQKKYWRAKRVLKEREREWTKVVKQQQDEYWQMINYLSEQMTKLTSALGDVQKTTGLQLRLPSPSDISPIIETTRAKSEQDPMLAPLSDLDLSDLETLPSDVEEEETQKVRKAKEEFDRAIPRTTLLDVSAARQKADLAARALVSRVLPSLQALKLNFEAQNYGGFDASKMWPYNALDPRWQQQLHPQQRPHPHQQAPQMQERVDGSGGPQYWNVPGPVKAQQTYRAQDRQAGRMRQQGQPGSTGGATRAIQPQGSQNLGYRPGSGGVGPVPVGGISGRPDHKYVNDAFHEQQGARREGRGLESRMKPGPDLDEAGRRHGQQAHQPQPQQQEAHNQQQYRRAPPRDLPRHVANVANPSGLPSEPLSPPSGFKNNGKPGDALMAKEVSGNQQTYGTRSDHVAIGATTNAQTAAVRDSRSGLLPSGTFETSTLGRHPPSHAGQEASSTGSLPRYPKGSGVVARSVGDHGVPAGGHAHPAQQLPQQQHLHQQQQHQNQNNQLLQQQQQQQKHERLLQQLHHQQQLKQQSQQQMLQLQRATYGTVAGAVHVTPGVVPSGADHGSMGYQWPRHVPTVTSATHVPLNPHGTAADTNAEMIRRGNVDDTRGSVGWGQGQRQAQQIPLRAEATTYDVGTGTGTGGANSPISGMESPDTESSQSQQQTRYTTVWQPGFVTDWSAEQVCQWLLAIGLEHLNSLFIENGVNGNVLSMMNSDYMRSIGMNNEDRARLKKRLKELRAKEEKQRKLLEKEIRQKDKHMKKAEKEKADLAARARRTNKY